MPFPYSPTAAWLEQVDVAFAHLPRSERGIQSQVVRTEPRAVIVPARHRLAERRELSVEEIIDETFLAYHPDVEPEWARFHNLDDRRLAPARTTPDSARTPAEMLTMMTLRQGIAVVPLCDAWVIESVLRGVVAIPLSDAQPAALSITWREGERNPGVRALVAIAAALGARDGASHDGAGSDRVRPDLDGAETARPRRRRG
jgi:DNA-binding transcriptional LysR family regulator